MRVLYGVVGEGLGHATRSRVVAERLLERGHEVKMVASGQALPYLRQYLPDVEEIWGTSFVLEQGEVKRWKTFSTHVRGGASASRTPGRREWRSRVRTGRISCSPTSTGLVPLRQDGPEARDQHRQHGHGGRCAHDATILRGVRPDYLTARAYVNGKIPRADHYVIATLFRPRVRLRRTTLAPPILRPEILQMTPGAGQPSPRLRANRRRRDRGAGCERAPVLDLRRARRRDRRRPGRETFVYRPFSNEGFIDDLGRARGVIASAGHSLMSEAVYLHKPMLAVPLAGQFEQAMNARYLDRMQYGTYATELDEPALERFLEREPLHEQALAGYEQDGNVETLRTIEQVIADVLAGRRRL